MMISVTTATATAGSSSTVECSTSRRGVVASESRRHVLVLSLRKEIPITTRSAYVFLKTNTQETFIMYICFGNTCLTYRTREMHGSGYSHRSVNGRNR